MSTNPEATTSAPKGTGNRRRPQRKRRGPARKPDGSPEAAAAAEARRKRSEEENVPVPEEMFGKRAVGVVSLAVRKGRLRFGYINITDGDTIDLTAPRIYFNFAQLNPIDLTVRRGYIMEFTCSKDEKGRSFAEDVKLTARGAEIAAAREREIAEKIEAENADPENAAKKERRIAGTKRVTLAVGCEGKTEEKMIEVSLSQSIGKLKNSAAIAFGAPPEYTVYLITDENPEGVFLNRALLNELKETDKLLLAPSRETTE